MKTKTLFTISFLLFSTALVAYISPQEADKSIQQISEANKNLVNKENLIANSGNKLTHKKTKAENITKTSQEKFIKADSAKENQKNTNTPQKIYLSADNFEESIHKCMHSTWSALCIISQDIWKLYQDLISQNRFESAEQLSFFLLQQMGQSKEKQKKYKTVLMKIIETKPEYSDVKKMKFLAYLHHSAGETKQALALIKKVEAIDIENPDFPFLIPNILFDLRIYPRALKHYMIAENNIFHSKELESQQHQALQFTQERIAFIQAKLQ